MSSKGLTIAGIFFVSVGVACYQRAAYMQGKRDATGETWEKATDGASAG